MKKLLITGLLVAAASSWAQTTTVQSVTDKAKALTDNEQTIVRELSAVQGKPVDIGGYYLADAEKCKAVMRPSPTLNAIVGAAQA